ncbi:MAG TPA: alkaline phosphatase family protein [Candidatus Solibacter sp.]|nr:alkaline phosphatase family protein [Candidatus Solibacter sp.]
MLSSSYVGPPPVRPFVVLALLWAFLTVAACGGSGPSMGPPSMGGGLVVPPQDHVFLVVLENHSFSQVIGSPSMPYLNSLAVQHGLATNYFANAHPSIGNYFMLTVGAVETVDDNFSGTITDNNIVRALTASGKTWKAYLESVPSQGYLGGDVGLYLKHHNPFAYLSDVVSSSAQAANLVPLSQFSADLAANKLPNFVYIKPNAENDAHSCPGGALTCPDADLLSAADAWLKNNIDPLITSPAFGNSLLIITFDESTLSDVGNIGGHVATVVVGPRVRPGFRSITMHQHQDTLRSMLQALQVSNMPNAAATANSMGEFFH